MKYLRHVLGERRVFLGFFAVYTAAAIAVLGVGLVTGLASPGGLLQDALQDAAGHSHALAPLATDMVHASKSSQGIGALAVDYVMSLINLAFGVFLISRRPNDVVARLLALGMVGTAMAFNYESHGVLFVIADTPFFFLNALHANLHAISGAAYLHALLLFPNGKLHPPAMRWFLLPVYAIMAFFVIVPWAGGQPFGDLITRILSYYPSQAIHEVIRLETLFYGIFFGILMPVAGVISQVHRFHTVSTARERQQTRVVVWALSMAFGLALLFLGALVILALTQEGASNGARLELLQASIFRLLTPPFAVIPIALLAAILKYRLFDINVLMNRTIVYGLLTAALGGAWGLSASLVNQIAGFFSESAAGPTASVIATVLVASIFSSVRQRVEVWVQERFFPDNLQMAEDFAEFDVAPAGLFSVAAMGEMILQRVGRIMESQYGAFFVLNARGEFEPVAVQGIAAERVGTMPPPAKLHDRWGKVRPVLVPAGYLFQILAPLDIPRLRREEVVAILALGPAADGRSYAWDDRKGLADFGRQMGPKISAAQLEGRQKT